MALSRVKTWISGEVLSASDLNSEFNNIINTPSSLICPITFNLTFTDATYDIGASGATRPRNGYFSGSITAAGLVGTATNNNASSGNVGEYIESVISSSTNYPATTVWGDLTSISLTAGDWDVTALSWALQNGSTCTEVMMGISATSGNASTGLVNGSNWMVQDGPDGDNSTSMAIPSFRVSLSGTTTYYLKYMATYAAGQPKAYGRLSARRVR